ncbi:MAG TPA: hypothetical protein VD833_03640 [Vicinamibacterales bacterium]|nr:hypothetical protein [Vicinamibacterales bacterium]
MDILRLPVVGTLLRRRRLRLSLQLGLLAIAVAIVLHGLLGPQIAPRNLATVLTSIHWRGLLLVAILLAGNLFCMACPMVLARDAGRRLIRPRLAWPRRLRRKWLGLGLLVVVLFSYELLGLWERPRATALLVLGYFALALAVDLRFQGAAFCKYVCPIGQFNFVASTMAPAEVQVRRADTCRACRTSDCVKGRRSAVEPARIERRGCELGLFLPAKVGNLDCTFCLDCVQACPHDNVAIATRVPGLELLETRRRSAIGRLTRRYDLAVLAVVFMFASLLTAFAMTGPARTARLRLGGFVSLESEGIGLALLFVAGLALLPGALLGGAAALARASVQSRAPLVPSAAPYVLALVPLGFGIWLGHYGFHLLTGLLTIVPVSQSAAIDFLGQPVLGEPAWSLAGLYPGSVFPVQLGFVLLGALGSLGLVCATSQREYPERAAAASAPWVTVVVLLTAAAVWIFQQPMDMRGVGSSG